MSKYKIGDKFIIEIKEVMRGDDICYKTGMRGSRKYLDAEQLDELEKLDSDYINDNFGELQDEAYETGLREAWELAITIEHGLIKSELKEIFGTDNEMYIVKEYTPQEAKSKIEAWEKSKEEIKVGDVVEIPRTKNLAVVCKIYPENERFAIMYSDGTVGTFYGMPEKTGEHIDIQSILEGIGGRE